MKYSVVLLVIFLSYAFSVHAQTKKPQLGFDGKRIIDVGTVIQGDTIKYNFTVVNKGNEPLVIYDIGKSCNCTQVSISNKIIQPAMKAKLEVVVSTDGKMGLSSINVVLKSNTPEEEHIVKLILNVVKKTMNDLPK